MQVDTRSTHPVYSETTPDSLKYYLYKILQNEDYPRYVCRNSKDDKFRYIGGSDSRSQLPIDFLFDTEIRRNISPYFEPKEIKRVCCGKAIPAIQSFSSAEIFASPRLDGEIGSEPGILPSPYCSAASQIPEGQLSSRAGTAPTASDDMLAVRTFVGAQDIRINHELGSRVPQESWHQMRSLSRRFSSSKQFKTPIARRHSFHGEDNAVTRLDSQFRKVCGDSDSMPRVSRHNMGHKTQRNVPVGVKVPNATQGTSTATRETEVVPQTVPKSNGTTQLRDFRDQKRPSSLSHAAILQQTVAKGSQVPSNNHSSTSIRRPRVVASSHRGVCTDPHKPDDSSLDNRCFRHWMGSTTWRSYHGGLLDQQTEALACKQKRNVCCACGDFARTGSSTRCSHFTPDRQSDGSVLHEQRRGHKVQDTPRANQEAYSRGRNRSVKSVKVSIFGPGQ
ncbi:uncharacterized protein LOC142974690 [Anticarsia gemmatalis]|uniref:uncharacterized protein LOC142974690 n=1 Tax=Anticarsia gemmatalis TaxID=129554 RepID=UPI003F76553F